MIFLSLKTSMDCKKWCIKTRLKYIPSVYCVHLTTLYVRSVLLFIPILQCLLIWTSYTERKAQSCKITSRTIQVSQAMGNHCMWSFSYISELIVQFVLLAVWAAVISSSLLSVGFYYYCNSWWNTNDYSHLAMRWNHCVGDHAALLKRKKSPLKSAPPTRLGGFCLLVSWMYLLRTWKTKRFFWGNRTLTLSTF